MMVCKLHPERELLPFPFLLAHMWPCEHCSQKYYYSVLRCSNTNTHTVLPTLSWVVFHSNKHLGKQKHAACRKKKPFTWGCPCLPVGQTLDVFSAVASLQAISPFFSPAWHCSLLDAPLVSHCLPQPGEITAEFLLPYRLSGHHISAWQLTGSRYHQPPVHVLFCFLQQRSKCRSLCPEG